MQKLSVKEPRQNRLFFPNLGTAVSKTKTDNIATVRCQVKLLENLSKNLWITQRSAFRSRID